MKTKTIAAFALAALVAAGCSGDGAGPLLSASTTAPGNGSTTAPPGNGATTTTSPTTTTLLAGVPRPLPIQEGLATFDTYVWRMEMHTVGPTAVDTSDTVIVLSADKPNDARLTETTQAESDAEETYESTTTITQVGNEMCTFDGEDYQYQEYTAQEREMIDLTTNLIDAQVIPGAEAVLVAEESVAGIPAAHYRYTLSGLGQDSGAVVVTNEVHYWISLESSVLLRYDLRAETRSGPTDDPAAEVFRVEATAELLEANGPVAIVFPSLCVAEEG